MFKNYLKIAFRNFAGTKLYSTINLLGLAIGLTACIFISLWVNNEMNYDSFNIYAEQIFRVEQKYFGDKVSGQYPTTGGPYASTLVEEYPEIENSVRFWKREYSVQDKNKVLHQQILFAVDNSIFEVFDYSLEKGDESTALIQPETVVLTKELAQKYFGTEDVIGKHISFIINEQLYDFTITGILKSVPANSHIQFEMLFSISSYFEFEFFDRWDSNYLYTYVLLAEGVLIADLETKFSSFMEKYRRPFFEKYLEPNATIDEIVQLKLKNVTDIHLNPTVEREIGPQGNKASVYIFSTIAILILVIACINFMNLSTARASKRAKEVGIRKSIGARSNQLYYQFLLEAIMISLIALIIALIFVWTFLPLFNQISGKEFSIGSTLSVNNLLGLLGITTLTGLISGLYPAFYLTSFEPVKVLKESKFKDSKKFVFRKYLVTAQFVISIGLIISTITINEQMKYVRAKSLGFDKENVITIPVKTGTLPDRFETFRNSLLEHSQIRNVSVSSKIPGDKIFNNTEFIFNETGKPFIFNNITSGFEFIDTYKIKMVAGRNFSRDFGEDINGSTIFNEAAVKKTGMTPEEIIGKKLDGKIIVGVVEDFHYKSLHRQIEPIVLFLNPDRIRVISVRIAPGDVNETLNYINEQFELSYSGLQFNYNFLDKNIKKLYENDEKMGNIILIFSSLSIFVACLGLFGLAAFTAEERTKEIGIRKVLGASISEIITMLSRDLLKLVFIANLFTWPIAWYLMNNWLDNFAYKTEIEWWVFLLAGSIALMIAIITVSSQSIKAALANPVESLRYE
jgi:putative ABC transport system permease protein